jgi:hypothetical protein
MWRRKIFLLGLIRKVLVIVLLYCFFYIYHCTRQPCVLSLCAPPWYCLMWLWQDCMSGCPELCCIILCAIPSWHFRPCIWLGQTKLSLALNTFFYFWTWILFFMRWNLCNLWNSKLRFQQNSTQLHRCFSV